MLKRAVGIPGGWERGSEGWDPLILKQHCFHAPELLKQDCLNVPPPSALLPSPRPWFPRHGLEPIHLEYNGLDRVSCRFPWDNVGTRPPHCPLGQCGGPQRCIRKPNFAPNFAFFCPKLPPESFRTLRIRCSRLSRFRLSYSRPNPWELDPVLSQKTFRT